MIVIDFDINSISENTNKLILDFFNQGKTIIFPSDTCYGLAVDPTNIKAKNKIYELKRRPLEKSISCIFKNIEQAQELADFDKYFSLIKENIPGAFTFIIKSKEYNSKKDTIGVRIPKNVYTDYLSLLIQKPYTSTSANISGFPNCYSLKDILTQFKTNDDILILDAGPLEKTLPSTVIDFTGENPIIIREGSGKINNIKKTRY